MVKLTSTMRETYENLGWLCATWARLDHTSTHLLDLILECGPERARCISTQLDPVASRMRLLKTLVMTFDHPAWWTDAAIFWINRIEGDVASRRNRMIHDAWDFTEATPSRIDRRVKIGRKQAFQSAGLAIETVSKCSSAEIRELIVEISVCDVALVAIAAEITMGRRESGLPPEERSNLVRMRRMESPLRELLQTKIEQTAHPSGG